MAIAICPISLPSVDGLSTLKGVVFVPEDTPKGILQISHGMVEHMGRYEHFMKFAAQQGYLCCGHDHLGHGQTSHPEKGLGFFSEKDGWRYLVEDVYHFGQEVKRQYGEHLPHCLLGHSMGSFIARLVIEAYGTEFDAAIISGTGGPNPMAGIGKLLAKLISAFKGVKHPSPLLDRMAFGNFNRLVAQPRTEKDWLTRDEAVVDRYLNDPYCTFLFTSSAFGDLMDLTRRANRKDWFRNYPKQLPTYLFAGSDDPVGNYGKGVEYVYHHLRSAGVQDVTLDLYPGGRHEMLNEINRDEVYEAVILWLDSHLKRKEENQ